MILDNLNPNYFSGQGQVFIAKLLTAAGSPGGSFLVGNATKFEVKPTMERRKHKESQSGQRLIDKVQTMTKGGTLDITFEDIRKDNLALALSGKKVTLASGSYTSGSPDTAPTGLVVGSYWRLTRPNVSSVVITDSAGSPATLVLGTHYAIRDAEHGVIEILNLASFTQPFKAAYSYAALDVITAMEANDDDEYEVYFAGVNTEASPDQKIGFLIFRAVFNAAELLTLINEEQGSFDLSAEILRHPTKAADANYGGFARWNYINANS